MQPRDIIAYLSDHYRGNWRKIYDHIVEQRPVPNEADHFADHYPCKIVTIMDDDYPKILQHCPKPPLALYYKGNLSLLDDESRCVAIIGSRAASDYGKKMAKSLGEGLAKSGAVVVSGIARGFRSRLPIWQGRRDPRQRRGSLLSIRERGFAETNRERRARPFGIPARRRAVRGTFSESQSDHREPQPHGCRGRSQAPKRDDDHCGFRRRDGKGRRGGPLPRGLRDRMQSPDPGWRGPHHLRGGRPFPDGKKLGKPSH